MFCKKNPGDTSEQETRTGDLENYRQIKEDDGISFAAFIFLYSVTDYVTARVSNPDYITDLLTVQLFLKHFCFSACILIVVFCIFLLHSLNMIIHMSYVMSCQFRNI
jgi:hypothetical protein